MNRRIYGEESELGALIKEDGMWKSHYRIKRDPGQYGSTAELQGDDVLDGVVRRISKICGGFQGHGGLIYYDSLGHPEVCTPETSLAGDLVLYSKACGELANDLIAGAFDAIKVVLIRDNTNGEDSKTFGCHENYLYKRDLDAGYDANKGISFRISHEADNNLILFLIARIPITGGGIISTREGSQGSFFLSNRGMHITDAKCQHSHGGIRPIIDMKSESLSSHEYERIHITCSDPNISEVSQYLKYGLTGLVLRLAEDKKLPFSSHCLNPVETIHLVSQDLNCREPLIRLVNGRLLKATDVLRIFLERIKGLYPAPDDPPDVSRETKDIIARTEKIIDKLEENPLLLNRELDWVIKIRLMESYLRQVGMTLSEMPRLFKRKPELALKHLFNLKCIEQKYHELSPDSYWNKICKMGQVERILSDSEIKKAKLNPPGFKNPPARTRSYARGLIVKKAQENGWLDFGEPGLTNWIKITMYNGPLVQRTLVIDMPDPFQWDLPGVNRFLSM